MSVVRTFMPSMLAIVQMGTNWSLSIWDMRYKSLERFSLKQNDKFMQVTFKFFVFKRLEEMGPLPMSFTFRGFRKCSLKKSLSWTRFLHFLFLLMRYQRKPEGD